MQIKLKKLMACVLVVALGLSSNVYPIFAEGITNVEDTEISSVQGGDASAGLVENEGNTKDTETTTDSLDDTYQNDGAVGGENTGSEREQNIGLKHLEEVENEINTNSQISYMTGIDTFVNLHANIRSNSGTVIGPVTVYGGTRGIDFEVSLHEPLTLQIFTSTHMHIEASGGDNYSRYIKIVAPNPGVPVSVSLRLHGFEYNPGDSMLFQDDATLYMAHHTVVNAPRGIVLTCRGNLTIRGIKTRLLSDANYSHSITVGGNLLMDGFAFLAQQHNNQQRMIEFDTNVGGRLVTINGGRWNYQEYPRTSAPEAAAPTVTTTGSTIRIAPVTTEFGPVYYSIDDGVNWQTDGVFEGLAPGTTYALLYKYGNSDLALEGPHRSVQAKTKMVSYSVSIPKGPISINDKVDIRLDSNTDFQVWNGGRVNVSIAKGVKDGVLILTRTDSDNTITSQLFVDGEKHTNEIIATFTKERQEPIPITFSLPDEQNVPAGTYTGTVTFKISYSE